MSSGVIQADSEPRVPSWSRWAVREVISTRRVDGQLAPELARRLPAP
ncbi:hypothetical protein ACFCWY_19915 [Streptomyces sp. NPDC056362]